MATFKVFIDNQVRRFKSSADLNEFKVTLATVLKQDGLSASSLTWKDSDGDSITISTNEEFVEAVNDANNGVVKIWVTTKPNVSTAPAPVPSTPTVSTTPIEIPSTPTVIPSTEEDQRLERTSPTPQATPPPPPPPPIVGVSHPYVTCDGSDQSPLLGTRYHKIGFDFDLNEAEFAKLDESEKEEYQLVLRPGGPVLRWEPVVHYHVACDASNTTPIYGVRFHKIGENYDLKQSEFAKLSEEEKRKYELINHPRATPVAYYTAPPAPTEEEIAIEQFLTTLFPGLVINRPGSHCGQQQRKPCNPRASGCPCRPGQKPERSGKCPCAPSTRTQAQRQRCAANVHGKPRPQQVAAGEVLPSATLAIGSSGPGVEQLQRFLIKHDLMPATAIQWRAGVFGHRTREAIYRFQALNGITTEMNGVYDKPTFEALLSLTNVTNEGNPQQEEQQQEEQPPKEEVKPLPEQQEQQEQDEPQQDEPESVSAPTDENATDEDNDDIVVVDAVTSATDGAVDEDTWENELNMLESMGFTDKEKLVSLLNKNKVADPSRPLLATVAALLK